MFVYNKYNATYDVASGGMNLLLYVTGATLSADTGPEAAQSGDSYIYLEASAPQRPGSVARLMSPNISSNG